MSLSVVCCNNIQIEPFKLKDLLSLKMEKKVNHHTKLYFNGILSEEISDKYIGKTGVDTKIEVNIVDESESTPLFKGVVMNVEVKVVNSVYSISVEAVSNTYALDIALQSKSFQDKGMTYESLVKKVVATSNGDFMDIASGGKSIEKFTMQYQETDWEFLKRMASRFNTGLVSHCISDKPKFYFGVYENPSNKSLEEFNYIVRKKISDFRNSSANHIKGITENDFIYYEIETGEFMEIGSSVNFKGKKLFVSEATTWIDKSVLKNLYVLTSKKGLSMDKIYNEKIIGLSIEGEVLEVEKDKLKVHLSIDDEQSAGEAWWFDYSTGYSSEGNSGWYCMPEKKDHVLVYFSNNKEESGVALSSVRKDSNKSDNNKVDNPDTKYFRTSNGKELMFSPKEVLISAKDGEVYIKLNEDDGIEIFSKKEIKISSTEDLTIDTGANLSISAEKDISISCKQSSITMDGVTIIKANQVKTN